MARRFFLYTCLVLPQFGPAFAPGGGTMKRTLSANAETAPWISKIIFGIALVCMIALVMGALNVRAAQADECEFLRRELRAAPVHGVVHVPEGTFECARPLVIDRDDVTLAGAGRGRTTLRLAPGTHAPLLIVGDARTIRDANGNFVAARRVRNVGVRDLSLDGNRWRQDARKECGGAVCEGDSYSVRNNGLTVRGATDVRIERVESFANVSGGLVTEKYCERLWVEDFEAYDNFFDGFAGYETVDSDFRRMRLTRNRGAGISLDLNFNANRFADVVIENSGDVGIFGRHARANRFENVIIQRSGNHGVFLARAEEATSCARDNEFWSLNVQRSERAGFRLNDACPGNRVRAGSDLCLNMEGAFSESSPGSLIVEQGVACAR